MQCLVISFSLPVMMSLILNQFQCSIITWSSISRASSYEISSISLRWFGRVLIPRNLRGSSPRSCSDLRVRVSAFRHSRSCCILWVGVSLFRWIGRGGGSESSYLLLTKGQSSSNLAIPSLSPWTAPNYCPSSLESVYLTLHGEASMCFM